MSTTANFKVDPRLASILGDSYTSSEHALKELIDNSWDAEATEVRVTLPTILSDDPIIVENNGFRDRRKQTLFIDARKLGTLIDRVHRELTDADLEKITSTYHAWRGDKQALNSQPSTINYSDVAGFCKSATTAEISAHGHVLTPGRYVGAEEVEDDGDPFEEKMPHLVAELHAQFAESSKLNRQGKDDPVCVTGRNGGIRRSRNSSRLCGTLS